jgi:hypothetical protein
MVPESFHNLKSETLYILPTLGTIKTGQQTPKVCGLFGLTVNRKAMGSDVLKTENPTGRKKRLWKTVSSMAKSKGEPGDQYFISKL